MLREVRANEIITEYKLIDNLFGYFHTYKYADTHTYIHAHTYNVSLYLFRNLEKAIDLEKYKKRKNKPLWFIT